LVPHKLNGVTQTVQLAYVRHQWSWTQLCQAGGIDPDDPGFLPPLKQRSANIAVDAAFQRHHLNHLDLSGYDQGFETASNSGDPGDTIHPVASAPTVMFNDPPLPPRDLLAKYRHLNIPVVTLNDTPNTSTEIDIHLSYTDTEHTPATEIPYIVRFANGETRQGTLDKKGNAVEKKVPPCGAEIEFCHQDTLDDINTELAGHYAQLKTELTGLAQAIGDRVGQAFANAKPPREEDQIKADFAASVREKIEALKTQAQQYDALAWYEKSWENIKATGAGLGDGVTEYIPDLGDFGDLIDHMDIDVTTIIQAIATGDITQLEADFQAWQERAGQGYEQASQTMEILIVLLSDRQTRALLASLPKTFLAVTPTDQLVELAVSQGTQYGIDGVAVVAVTAGGTLINGPGGALAGAATITATTARKAAKALQAVTDILMHMAKTLKKKRNKRKSNTLQDNKTALPDKKQAQEKAPKKCGFSFGKTNKCNKPYNQQCPLCNNRQRGKGDNARNPTTLKNGIQNNWRKDPDYASFTLPQDHPWYYGDNTIQQHHIITIEAVGGTESSLPEKKHYWRTMFNAFEYDINDAHNSIVLPARHEEACQLAAPLHFSNHEDGRGFPGLNYVKSVERLLRGIRRQVKRNEFCESPKLFKARMAKKSKNILKYLDEFTWTLTTDGDDYKPNSPGCQGAKGIEKKKNQPHNVKLTCLIKRQHNIRHKNSDEPMTKQHAHPDGTLRIGY
ncbi:MAG: hypothetical protein GXP14_02395, partial [Gammaproteobacteria bacterium]|nr:hypothetical protein [Gammaproteobacteria bacterium]